MSVEKAPELRVLSFNCWGLRFVSKYRTERLKAVGEKLAKCDYDIVLLQEVWSIYDFQEIRNLVSCNLVYSRFFHSAAMGAGLAMFSKFPIIESSMNKYPLNGRPQAFWRGDWYVGKGVATASLQHPSGRIISLFNTHLHAPYGKGADTYLCHRLSQAWYISKLLRAAVQRGHIVIAAGDFNIQPLSVPHEIITSYGLVNDAWLSVYPDQVEHPPNRFSMNDKELVEIAGTTCDSRLNTWRENISSKDMDDFVAKRLDYVFHSPSTCEAKNAKVVFLERVPKLDCSYSDHFAIETVLSIKLQPIPVQETRVSYSIIDDTLGITYQYMARERLHMRLRIAHLLISIPLIIGVHVAIAWCDPAWLKVIILFFTVMLTIAAVVNGFCIGLLFGRWEFNGLLEFVAELKEQKLLCKQYLVDHPLPFAKS
ncbi:plasma membrane inositol phosphosphingolipid phospholipase C, Css1 [Schizosaccharomyces pombe]|uniref:Inositol phosphosphingolipids phospholipase C n=1 Tax=Schizosaccharomyces pombe (strain 972 / ATCC 24843) TaxID=284812 RepID=CSS1_SCHPO|nr:inositol phosphosphingolipid phospholipase C Css1 [Schizosaccharomyces pombe]O74369.2 RecName: Full=Inositol phosphosphingolipids phospholipase C; Short=IPS phospholipase C; Short=IPS-PLC [Schizosaccharomyces pombe 972h-]CAB39367.2 inositol phosphosphingolipid phospholipase C, Css1 [Schizosaccharomyces pombe]|eukprot:NP_001342880.1 inositol phosphosphingolipid phospholipase C Css1 [Schizosaccharomyces pombe]